MPTEHFIVSVGLARRLIQADNAEQAVEKYLSDVPLRRSFSGVGNEVRVRPASVADVAEFQKRRGAPVIDDQLALVLGDLHRPDHSTSRTSKKEHA